ncbi:MAG: RhuM family protein [Candidatus Delongbacteria bacterium]|jgi:hypothetical protein|nr:RhuM family protein [Candidatus Delongbacteria bacterium]
MKNEIILYQSDELAMHIDVRVEDDTVWLNRNQIAALFNRDIKTIGKHINNVFSEGELDRKVVVAKFATTMKHGAIEGKTQTQKVEYYNLDVIISVGYRVKSKQGTQFRIWANSVLKDYLLKGYSLNNRINRIEDNLYSLIKKVDNIDLQIHTDIIPKQGIFFKGQIFYAYNFVSNLFKSAKESLTIIDNYIDNSVLIHLTEVKKNVKVKILTSSVSEKLKQDIDKFEKQYFPIEIKIFKQSHDRFVIIDSINVYHIGASLKDLGKKLFGFSKMDKLALDLLVRS